MSASTTPPRNSRTISNNSKTAKVKNDSSIERTESSEDDGDTILTESVRTRSGGSQDFENQFSIAARSAEDQEEDSLSIDDNDRFGYLWRDTSDVALERNRLRFQDQHGASSSDEEEAIEVARFGYLWRGTSDVEETNMRNRLDLHLHDREVAYSSNDNDDDGEDLGNARYGYLWRGASEGALERDRICFHFPNQEGESFSDHEDTESDGLPCHKYQRDYTSRTDFDGDYKTEGLYERNIKCKAPFLSDPESCENEDESGLDDDDYRVFLELLKSAAQVSKGQSAKIPREEENRLSMNFKKEKIDQDRDVQAKLQKATHVTFSPDLTTVIEYES